MGIRNPGKGEFQKEKKKEKRGKGRNQDERNEGGGPGTPLPTWRLGFSREEATSSIKKEKEGEDERNYNAVNASSHFTSHWKTFFRTWKKGWYLSLALNTNRLKVAILPVKR